MAEPVVKNPVSRSSSFSLSELCEEEGRRVQRRPSPVPTTLHHSWSSVGHVPPLPPLHPLPGDPALPLLPPASLQSPRAGRQGARGAGRGPGGRPEVRQHHSAPDEGEGTRSCHGDAVFVQMKRLRFSLSTVKDLSACRCEWEQIYWIKIVGGGGVGRRREGLYFIGPLLSYTGKPHELYCKKIKNKK